MTDDGASGQDRTECWRCGYMRLTYESCPECGGSCKPLTKQKQQEADG
jgi:rRNA maturation protein Nop10